MYLQFHIHNGGGEALHAYMNKDILPNEWGGKAGTFQELNGEYNIFYPSHFFIIPWIFVNLSRQKFEV